jgi:arylsulfatase A-like enzyme
VPLSRLLARQGFVFGLIYLGALAAFVRGASEITERFGALARGPYLTTSLVTQARMLPAYAVMALVCALLVRPFVKPGRWLLLRVAACDAAVLLCALGPFLLFSPGSFDSVARHLTFVSLFQLQRFGVLHALSLLFVVLVVRAALHALPSARARIGVAAASFLTISACFVTPSPARAKPAAKKNVLIIAADSWRYDRLGVHGSPRTDLTPHLDAFAKGAVDFQQHHVATASTLESWVTFFTGLFPPQHGIRSMYPSKAEVDAVEQRPTLASVLRTRGYETFVSSDWAGNCFDLIGLGFEHRRVSPVQNFEALLQEQSVRAHPLVPLFFAPLPGALGDALVPGRESLSASTRPGVLVDQLFDDIDSSAAQEKPFLGLLFVSPTHLPYNARSPFNAKYVDPAYDGPNRYHVDIDAHELITTGFAPTLSPAAIAHVRNLYDGAVSDFDDTVGDVLRRLEARGLLDDTIVIVTSDHGEDLYEPGSTVGHGTNFFGGDQSTRIPFLVRAPGLAPRVVTSLTRSADVFPTLLTMLGEAPPAAVDGVDLLPLARGQTDDLGLTAFAETCYLFFPKAKAMLGLSEAERAQVVDLAGAADTLEVDPSFHHNLVLRPQFRQPVIDAKDRMARTATWKLIQIPGKQTPVRRLYDMTRDPQQQVNLAGQGLPIEAELARQLDAWEAP